MRERTAATAAAPSRRCARPGRVLLDSTPWTGRVLTAEEIVRAHLPQA